MNPRATLSPGQAAFEPIAIIGEGCIYPEAASPQALWELVRQARVVISQPDETVGCGLRRPGGFVRGSGAWLDDGELDKNWGSVPLRELDVLFHWSLYAARRALQSTPYAAAEVLQRTGVIMGNLSFPTRQFGRFAEGVIFKPWEPFRKAPAAAIHPANRFMSGLPPLVVAQTLGLGGCAFALDAACASSLYALKLACDQLHRREADLMLAGGAAAADPMFLEDGFETLHALSDQGICRPFSSAADGLLPCEGAAFVVLKRFADAVRDGDAMLGVVRGIGVSNSGRAGGFLASSREGQIRCMNAALRQAGVDSETISFVECHATGTPVGDVAELRSLLHVYGADRTLAIGSIKANIGHPITAAGMAGLLKVLHAFKHRAIPPTPNSRPLLKMLGRSNLLVPETLQDWESAGPRRAGLSGFGFGGNNAHVILQEWNHDAHVFPTLRQPTAEGPLAVVAAEVFTTRARTTRQFVEALISGRAAELPAEGEGAVALDPKETVFPPLDLRHTLPQQLVVLDLVNKALRSVAPLEAETSGVFVGIGVDSETNRYSLRHRLQSILEQYQFTIGERETAELAEDITPPLIPATVVGSLSNIPANRVNVQHDLGGQGFTVSCEELSGDQALSIAANALRQGELSSVVVGAIDLGAEPVHETALRELGRPHDPPPANGAVVLILQTLETARRAGNRVLAILDSAHPAASPDFELGGPASLVSRLFGHSHAAAGLMNLAAAVLLLARRALPGGLADALVLEPRAVCARVQNQSRFGPAMSWHLQSDTAPEGRSPVLPRFCAITTFSAEGTGALIRRLQGEGGVAPGPVRLAIVDDPENVPARCREAAALLAAGNPGPGWLAPNIVFHEAREPKKIAFVYTGAAAAYREMGRSLLRELPWLVERVRIRAPRLVHLSGWLGQSAGGVPSPEDQLIGGTFLCQVHNEFTRRFLKVTPDAVMGVSSGETNAVMATGLWPDIDGYFRDLTRSEVFSKQIGGELQTVRAAWSQPRVSWENWVVVHEVSEVRRRLAGEPRVYITIVYTDQHCVISGDPAACRRVVQALGPERAIRQTFDVAAHCAALEPFAEEWIQIHTRPTAPLTDGIVVYANHTNASYAPTSEQIGRQLTGQFIEPIDLPKTVRRAWDDGIRVFVEHGPRDTLSRAIGTILKGKPHVCIPLDAAGACAVTQAAKAAAELWCLGAGVDPAKISPSGKPVAGLMHYPVRWKPISVARITVNAVAASDTTGETFVMSPPRIDFRVGDAGANDSGLRHPVQRIHERASAAHAAYLNRQLQCQRRFQEYLRAALPGKGLAPAAPARKAVATPEPAALPAPAGPPGPRPRFTREDLIGLASGRISDYFGPQFRQQDDYPIQVRMPEPPLLLCDRVTRIEGQPGVLSAATIWTETDVRADWYLHNGRMAACAVIESGQADLLLISWLGIDFENKGQRAYRLLGSHITFHRELPRPGETLKFEIRITGYARQGEVRIFFFDYDCLVNGTKLISARRGHAGFFTKEELKQSKGVLWNPAEAQYSAAAPLALSAVRTQKRSFSSAEIQAFAAGHWAGCFGGNPASGPRPVRTPGIQGGEHTFIGEVAELDLAGGPAGRGYARAVKRIEPGAWYFTGHFRNDPCMPGTLMAEGCMQLMSFYLAAAGLTVDRDGWRFEPVPEKTYPFLCRGQVTPASHELVFELFVDELKCDPWPRLRAHALATVDGIKALLCEGLEVRLVPEAKAAPATADDGQRNPPLKNIIPWVPPCHIGAIELGVAVREPEIAGCHDVVQAVFVDELGQTLDHRYLADSIQVFSRDAERVFGTITITASGRLGLPLERSVPLPAGYAQKNTVQFSKLAILKSHRGQQNYQLLLGRFAVGLLRNIQKLGYQSLILESILSPMHQAFYKMLGLKIIGEPYRYVGWPERAEPNHILMGNMIDDCLAGFQAHFPPPAVVAPGEPELLSSL